MSIIDEIEDYYGIVQQHATTPEQRFSALERERPDACILNIRLGDEMVYPLADKLVDMGVLFIFASSQPRKHIPERFARIPLHSKPIDIIRAAAGLIKAA